MIQFIHNYECSKSNFALKALEEEKVEFEIRNYLSEPLSRQELSELIKKMDTPVEELIRKSEPLFKEKFEGKVLKDEEWIDALASFPVLLQRPILVDGEVAIVARTSEAVFSFIDKSRGTK